MEFVEADSWVWFRHPEERWLPCRVLTGGTDGIQLSDESGQEYTTTGERRARRGNPSRLRADHDPWQLIVGADCLPMHESSLSSVPNMVDLGDLNEASILHNLRSRYRS